LGIASKDKSLLVLFFRKELLLLFWYGVFVGLYATHEVGCLLGLLLTGESVAVAQVLSGGGVNQGPVRVSLGVFNVDNEVWHDLSMA
jgi:hypothetical protein